MREMLKSFLSPKERGEKEEGPETKEEAFKKIRQELADAAYSIVLPENTGSEKKIHRRSSGPDLSKPIRQINPDELSPINRLHSEAMQENGDIDAQIQAIKKFLTVGIESWNKIFEAEPEQEKISPFAHSKEWMEKMLAKVTALDQSK